MSGLNREYLAKLGQMDPELQLHLRRHPLPPMTDDLETRRAMAAALKETILNEMSGSAPDIKRTDLPYHATDGTQLCAVLFQPEPLPEEGCPMILQIHGGGFTIGAPEFEEALCRNLVRAFDAVVYSISYRLAPEYTFPQAAKDSLDALRFVSKHATTWGSDPHKKGFIIGGCSAGGNLAAALTLWTRDNGKGIPPITGQYLLNPWLAMHGKVPEGYQDTVCSYEQNADAPVLSGKTLKEYLANYKPRVRDDWFDILYHSKGHNRLPPTYFQISGFDPLRDEAFVYDDMLRNAGVETTVDVYAGLPHIFWMVFPVLRHHVQRFRKDQMKGFGWLLNRFANESAVLYH